MARFVLLVGRFRCSRSGRGCRTVAITHPNEPINEFRRRLETSSLNLAEGADVHRRIEHRCPRDIGDAAVVTEARARHLPPPNDSHCVVPAQRYAKAANRGSGGPMPNLREYSLALFGEIDKVVIDA